MFQCLVKHFAVNPCQVYQMHLPPLTGKEETQRGMVLTLSHKNPVTVLGRKSRFPDSCLVL